MTEAREMVEELLVTADNDLLLDLYRLRIEIDIQEGHLDVAFDRIRDLFTDAELLNDVSQKHKWIDICLSLLSTSKLCFA